MLEADDVKLVIVYIEWGLKQHYVSGGKDMTDENTVGIAPNVLASRKLYSFVCPAWPLQEAEF